MYGPLFWPYSTKISHHLQMLTWILEAHKWAAFDRYAYWICLFQSLYFCPVDGYETIDCHIFIWLQASCPGVPLFPSLRIFLTPILPWSENCNLVMMPLLCLPHLHRVDLFTSEHPPSTSYLSQLCSMLWILNIFAMQDTPPQNHCSTLQGFGTFDILMSIFIVPSILTIWHTAQCWTLILPCQVWIHFCCRPHPVSPPTH